MGTDELWEKATIALKDGLIAKQLVYKIQEGDGAFYGPKIEIKIEDAMGREWQCGTIQVDFNLPKNFELEYIQTDQTRAQPVMLHRAIFGSIERFLGILVEHFKGRFPFWLAPEQIRILAISEKQNEYACKLRTLLREQHLFVEIDDSNDKISAKIRRAQVEQIPWMLVIGGREEETQTVTLRKVTGEQVANLSINELIAMAIEAKKIA
jgi:threonyl-tRNA synthetase